MKSVVSQDLTTTLDMAPESGLSTSIIEAIQKSRGALGDPVPDEMCESVMSQHEAILGCAKAIARASQDMVGKASINPDCLSGLAQVW